jgi:hypothetical protein
MMRGRMRRWWSWGMNMLNGVGKAMMEVSLGNCVEMTWE